MASKENSGTPSTAPEKAYVRFSHKTIDGVPLIAQIIDNWEKLVHFQARPDDLLIATFPKAGTTWMQEIVDMIYKEGDAEVCKRAPVYERMPFLEWPSIPPMPSGIEVLDGMPSPRVIKTHLQFKHVPKSFWENNCKMIYMARNPKDNLVSYYHFERMTLTQIDPGTWEEYLGNFMQGNELFFSKFYKQTNNLKKKKIQRNVLYIFFENSFQNPKREILKVLTFLGRELPDDVVEKIVHHTSFESMKINPMTNYTTLPKILPKTIFRPGISSFMRKGQ
uniref:Sulfotransferase n=1 Tax=Latimeria chalumnae TaxID=7897 RepID=H3AII6_LATCH